jgi:hypothetical protein
VKQVVVTLWDRWEKVGPFSRDLQQGEVQRIFHVVKSLPRRNPSRRSRNTAVLGVRWGREAKRFSVARAHDKHAPASLRNSEVRSIQLSDVGVVRSAEALIDSPEFAL